MHQPLHLFISFARSGPIKTPLQTLKTYLVLFPM